jgi:hypothetical protein
MPQIYPDEGLIQSLLSVADNGGTGLKWALFTNDITPDLASELTDFDLADVAWGQVTLKAIDFTQSLVNLNVGTIQAAAVVFTNSGGTDVDVYGYLAFDPIRNCVVLCNRYDDAPRTVVAGGTLSLVPMMGDSSLVLTDVIDGGTF